MAAPKYTPALSRSPTDSSTDEEAERAVRTPSDRATLHHYRVVSQGQLVPAHSPDGEFVGETLRVSTYRTLDLLYHPGTPFSTSNMFEYPFHPEDSSPKGSKLITVTTGASVQHTGYASTGSGSPSSPYYVRALREVSKEAPIPPSLREKVTALGA
jgi:hypothetical protein